MSTKEEASRKTAKRRSKQLKQKQKNIVQNTNSQKRAILQPQRIPTPTNQVMKINNKNNNRKQTATARTTQKKRFKAQHSTLTLGKVSSWQMDWKSYS